jgi:hypothetical protein
MHEQLRDSRMHDKWRCAIETVSICANTALLNTLPRSLMALCKQTRHLLQARPDRIGSKVICQLLAPCYGSVAG